MADTTSTYASGLRGQIESWRARNRQIKEEGARKIAPFFKQAASQVREEEGYRKAASQLSEYATAYLGKPGNFITSANVRETGVLGIQQGFAIEKEQQSAVRAGIPLTESDSVTQVPIPVLNERTKLAQDRSVLADSFSSKYPEIYDTTDAQALVEDIEHATNKAELNAAKVRLNVEFPKLQDIKVFTDMIDKNILVRPELAKLYVAPKFTSNESAEERLNSYQTNYYTAVGDCELGILNDKIAAEVNTKLGKAYKEMTSRIKGLNKSQSATQVIGWMSQDDKYKNMFNESNSLINISPEFTNVIWQMATEIDNENEGLVQTINTAEAERKTAEDSLANEQLTIPQDEKGEGNIFNTVTALLNKDYILDSKTGVITNVALKRDADIGGGDKEKAITYYKLQKPLQDKIDSANKTIAESNSRLSELARDKIQSKGLPPNLVQKHGGVFANISAEDVVNIGRDPQRKNVSEEQVTNAPTTITLKKIVLPDAESVKGVK